MTSAMSMPVRMPMRDQASSFESGEKTIPLSFRAMNETGGLRSLFASFESSTVAAFEFAASSVSRGSLTGPRTT